VVAGSGGMTKGRETLQEAVAALFRSVSPRLLLVLSAMGLFAAVILSGSLIVGGWRTGIAVLLLIDVATSVMLLIEYRWIRGNISDEN
jgi:hypothetical protein